MSVSAITTAELSRAIRVSIDRIVWAHKTGRLPEPGKVGHHRAHTPEEVEGVQVYFEASAQQKQACRHQPQAGNGR
jgi:hypothetical protein